MNFAQAIEELKKGNAITRKFWDKSNAKVCIRLQRPDENSFMTQEYMYMEINESTRYPLELTWDLVLAEDFYSLHMGEECDKPETELKVVE